MMRISAGSAPAWKKDKTPFIGQPYHRKNSSSSSSSSAAAAAAAAEKCFLEDISLDYLKQNEQG